jgi:hypothetical protein
MLWKQSVVLLLSMSVATCDGPTTPKPEATRLAFLVAPGVAEGAVPFNPASQVAVLDQFGNTDVTATTAVTITIGENPAGAALIGLATVNAVAGVATFPELRIDRPASGYTLVATAPGLTSATSAPFPLRAGERRVHAQLRRHDESSGLLLGLERGGPAR